MTNKICEPLQRQVRGHLGKMLKMIKLLPFNSEGQLRAIVLSRVLADIKLNVDKNNLHHNLKVKPFALLWGI